jgi:hypothetical protein
MHDGSVYIVAPASCAAFQTSSTMSWFSRYPLNILLVDYDWSTDMYGDASDDIRQQVLGEEGLDTHRSKCLKSKTKTEAQYVAARRQQW